MLNILKSSRTTTISFLRLHHEVSAYCSLKVSDYKWKKILFVPNNFFMIIDVRTIGSCLFNMLHTVLNAKETKEKKSFSSNRKVDNPRPDCEDLQYIICLVSWPTYGGSTKRLLEHSNLLLCVLLSQ